MTPEPELSAAERREVQRLTQHLRSYSEEQLERQFTQWSKYAQHAVDGRDVRALADLAAAAQAAGLDEFASKMRDLVSLAASQAGKPTRLIRSQRPLPTSAPVRPERRQQRGRSEARPQGRRVRVRTGSRGDPPDDPDDLDAPHGARLGGRVSVLPGRAA